MKKYRFDKEAFNWLRDLVLDNAPSLNYLCYAVNDGGVRATNGRVTCYHPCTDENSYLVDGREIERFLPVLIDSDDLNASLTEKNLILTKPGFRAQIPKLPYEDWHFVEPGNVWRKLPTNFVHALECLRPFISDNAAQAWATAIYIDKDIMLATNNVSIVKYEIETGVQTPVMLPVWAVDFILSRDGVVEFEGDSKHIAFRWANGAWMSSVLIAGQFPETAISLAREVDTSSAQPITDEWRRAFKEVAPLADSVIELTASAIIARREQSHIEADMPNVMPENQERTLWPSKTLQNIINISTDWGPQLWPAPAPFKGTNISGLVVGKRV